MIVAASLMAAISLCVIYLFQAFNFETRSSFDMQGRAIFRAILWIQALILAAGGSIVCVNSIYKEKEQNSFDYQRMTKLTPFELAIGKLLGAPALMYFLCVCLMPAALYGAYLGRVDFSFVAAAYAVLLTGSIAFHIFSLLVSLLAFRGSNTSAIVLVILVLWFSAFGGLPFGGALRIGTLGPFFAPELSMQTTWNIQGIGERLYYDWGGNPMVAIVFGHNINQAAANIVVSVTIGLWLLVAVVRNIKRDANVYELFTPWQGLSFALYLNVLLLAFMRWRWGSAVDTEAFFLSINIFVFSLFGLSQLRNRERMRVAVRHETAEGSISLKNALWPMPILVLGASVAVAMGIFALSRYRDPQASWNLSLATLRGLFFVLWIARDLQYLQWMSLRRGKFPLVLGLLYLAVFYACTSTVLAAAGAFREITHHPYTALLLPSPIYLLDERAWATNSGVWIAAFVLQAAMVGAFLLLQRRTMSGLVAANE